MSGLPLNHPQNQANQGHGPVRNEAHVPGTWTGDQFDAATGNNPALHQGGQYNATERPVDVPGHGVGAAGAPVGHQSHYGEGSESMRDVPQQDVQYHPDSAADNATGSGAASLTGRVEAAAGSLLGNENLKQKGLEKQYGQTNKALGEAERLEHQFSTGAHPENK